MSNTTPTIANTGATNYPGPVRVTDAASNIFPAREHKRRICQNAIGLAKALGFAQTKVAVPRAYAPRPTSPVE